MFLTRLMYISERNPETSCDVEQILESARRLNSQNEITGALWFNGDYFVQVLEGGRRAVSQTYHRIAKDPRHKNIELVECRVVSERFFYNWSMAYHGDTKSNREKVRRFSVHDSFSPREMSPDSLWGLLRAMADEESSS